MQELAKLIPKGSFYWYLPRHGAVKAKLSQQTIIGSVPAREKHAVEMRTSFLWMDGNSTTSWILLFPPPTYLGMAQLGSITIQMAFTAFCIINVFDLLSKLYCVLPDHKEQADDPTSGKDQTMFRSPFTIAPTLFHNNPNQGSLLYFQ